MGLAKRMAYRTIGIGPAKQRSIGLRRGGSFLFRLQGFVALQQAFEDGDSGAEKAPPQCTTRTGLSQLARAA